MVCSRCVLTVETTLLHLGLHPLHIELGEAEIREDLTPKQHTRTQQALQEAGFDLLRDKPGILLQTIKSLILQQTRNAEEPPLLNLSAYLSNQLAHDYTYMSNLFSETFGITIERFYIHHKIERVKQMLTDNRLTLTEIAYLLHYSSVAHLSNQFKKVTGQTPSQFRKQQRNPAIASQNDPSASALPHL